MVKYTILLFLLFFGSIVDAQLASTDVLGAKLRALGASGATLTGIESINSNQAGLTDVENLSILVSSENRFSLNELISASVAIGKRIDKYGILGFIASNFGIDAYREQHYGLSYSRLLSDKTSIGTQFDLYHTRITEFGNRNTFGFQLGIQHKITEEVNMGIHSQNPTGLFSNTARNISSHIKAGLAYTPSENVSLYGDLSYIKDYRTSAHFGLEYRLLNELDLRLGIQTNPSTFGVGIGYNLNQHFTIDGSISSHQYLGNTPAISLGYNKD